MYSVEEELKFIIYLREVAKSVAEKYGGGEELESAALEGLVEAIKKFDPDKAREKDYKFSTYATWFMKEAVESALED
ncbi:MAG: hypothetical protein ACOC6Q_02435 [Patescibacteria group bacterium]